jgi:DNA polymerase-3 subunit alpha
MNALYQDHWNISFFRSTKNGEEEIKYDLDACEKYLGETVYQEQVMLCPNH